MVPIVVDPDDLDLDGVPNGADLCPNTAPGAVVDSNGDGAKDNVDPCPGTPAGTPVNAAGCPITPPPPTNRTCDVTGDGFIDYRDIRLIILDISKSAAGPNDPRDATRNGKIDLLDATICTKRCDRNFCLPPK